MLERHLQGTNVKIGVGANRAAVASKFFQRYGYMCPEKISSDNSNCANPYGDRIGAAILDDGMQHLSLERDIEIVMVNAMVPWGNHHLLPLGPLREPFSALNRADVVVVHHADMVSKHDIEAIEAMVRKYNKVVPIFFSMLAPLHFMKGNISYKLSLKDISHAILLCVSAIGSADSFVRRIEKMGPMHVDRLDFSDHQPFLPKDYYRDPEVFEHLDYEVQVLCSCLQILPFDGCEDSFKKCLLQHLELRLSV